jgi:hypothetical protein
MKNIDPKSLIIGVLATALVFACTDSNKKNSASLSLVTEAKAATSKDDRGKWDNEQEWEVAYDGQLQRMGLITRVAHPGPDGQEEKVDKVTGGWEPYNTIAGNTYFRRRIK